MQEPIKFEVHYHGAPVLVGERYDPKDLHAHLINSNKEFIDVRSDLILSDNLITQTGQNSFYATYNYNGETLIDYFTVYGYTNKRYQNMDLKVFYIHEDQNNYEEDVTDYFYPLFYDDILGKIYVTINRLDKLLYKGKFRIIFPQDSGLYHQYATEWIVLKNNSNIKMTLVKTYNEEVI